jgi:hypothetical protein
LPDVVKKPKIPCFYRCENQSLNPWKIHLARAALARLAFLQAYARLDPNGEVGKGKHLRSQDRLDDPTGKNRAAAPENRA